MRGELPEFREWSIAAVHLLRGVVEAEDGRAWNILLSHRSSVESYFARIGLLLVVDESEGFSYLRQFPEEQLPDGYEALPKLFHATRLSYGQTLLCVLLRDALRRFEEEEVLDERCVVDESELLEIWRTFSPQQVDDVKQIRELQTNLRKLEGMGFVRPFGQEPGSWEVRRILKARVNADELEHLYRQLSAVTGASAPDGAIAELD
ncbi:DUF4194 domain-containing protein [Lacipirellula parvula]|uniref:DUF4194 domain-containing protein n=1 Tax=Lacipirellula parvula TaxID=2650471 RepID=A0A5K7X337_9BACT|nr:DUF4194 domain-containing protein [Lacipirellula parvula]BBO31068.1 hypothetical protein PLANPX_0680 [Lacipirellula parvula]